MNGPAADTCCGTCTVNRLLRLGATALVSSLGISALTLVALMLILRVTEVGTFGICILVGASSFLVLWIARRVVFPRWGRVRPQFSLRLLLAATAVLGIGFGCIGFYADRFRREKQIVSSILAEGGTVSFGPPGDWHPKWLYRRLGVDAYLALCGVDCVILDQCTLRDRTLPSLRGLRFHGLSLSRSNVSDAHLAQLRAFPELQELTLQYCALSDDGLKHLAAISNLRRIDLWGTGAVTDGAVAELQRALPKCTINR